MPIKDLPIYLKPREKAWQRGVTSLSDIELLAIIIRSGVRQYDSLYIARQMLESHQSLKGVFKALPQELCKIPGIGPIKALELKIISELFIRINLEQSLKFNTLLEIVNFAFQTIGHFESEAFLIVVNNGANQLLYYEVMYKGTKKEVSIEPKEVIALVLKKKVKSFIVFTIIPQGIFGLQVRTNF